MARSANRTVHPVSSPRTETQTLFAHLIGAGAADLTLDAQGALNGEILTAARSGAGKYTLTFRYVYPELLQAPVCSFVGTTDGLVGQCSAIDITTAGTAALEIYVGSTPTDLATTDTIYLSWSVRNSGKNK
jgi:hypothetical protein